MDAAAWFFALTTFYALLMWWTERGLRKMYREDADWWKNKAVNGWRRTEPGEGA